MTFATRSRVRDVLLGRKLSEKAITYGAATLFATFGGVLVAEGAGWL